MWMLNVMRFIEVKSVSQIDRCTAKKFERKKVASIHVIYINLRSMNVNSMAVIGKLYSFILCAIRNVDKCMAPLPAAYTMQPPTPMQNAVSENVARN